MIWRRAGATYAASHFGKSLLWTGSDLLPLYLLVSVYRVDPTKAGMVFLVGLAANAATDLGVGIWLSRHPRHAAMLAGGALVLAGATFPATVLVAPWGMCALLAATLAFRIAYSACDVPHNSLLTRLGDTPARAVCLARYRTIATAAASLLAAAIASAGGITAVTPLLCGIAAAGALISSAMVPLLRAFPPIFPASPRRSPMRQATDGLPLPFLVASVIGIVALGALAKAVLHLPPGLHHAGDGTTVLILLIVGRTVSAVLPIRLRTIPWGLMCLALIYVGAAVVAAGFAWTAGPAMLVMLGLAMGASNLVGWAILPLLAVGPRGYGVYTMASKLALGLAGLMLAGGLGRVPTFAPDAYVAFVLAVAIACLVAAAMLVPCLTPKRSAGFPAE